MSALRDAVQADPTDTEILAAVERWAEASVLLTRYSGSLARLGGWQVTLASDWPRSNYQTPIRIKDQTQVEASGPHGEGRDYYVDPTTALVWALLVESEPLDVGRCPACVARSGTRKLATHDWAQREWGAYWSNPQTCQWDLSRIAVGPMLALSVDGAIRWSTNGHKVMEFASRPCPDCNGTGRDVREAARVVLDAAPQVAARQRAGDPLIHEVPTVWREGSRSVARQDHDDGSSVWIRLGDPAALEALAILADRLEHAGSPLGPLLSAWLREQDVGRLDGWRGEALDALDARWTSLTVPCERCEETGLVTLYGGGLEVPGAGPNRTAATPCESCHGHGRLIQ